MIEINMFPRRMDTKIALSALQSSAEFTEKVSGRG